MVEEHFFAGFFRNPAGIRKILCFQSCTGSNEMTDRRQGYGRESSYFLCEHRQKPAYV